MIQNECTNSTPLSSFLIIPTNDTDNVNDDRIEVTRMYSTEEHQSQRDSDWFDRDTSNTSSHSELNNTRDSASTRQEITVVNTHDSILDLDSQCDDGEEDTSFCDEDENMMGIMEEVPTGIPSVCNGIMLPMDTNSKSRAVSPISSHRNIREKRTKPNVTNHNGLKDYDDRKHKKIPSAIGNLTLYSVTDSFVDSICTSTACVVSDNYENMNGCSKSSTNRNKSAIASMDDKIREFQESCGSAIFNGCDAGRYTNWQHGENSSLSHKAIVSMDIWRLLGCSSPPGESELAEIWSLKTTSQMLRKGRYSKNGAENKHPVRASIKKRLKRIHRLRMDDRRVSGATRHGITITNQSIYPSDQTLNTMRKEVHMNKTYTVNNTQNSSGVDENDNQDHQSREPRTPTQTSYRAIEKSYSMLDDSLASFIGQGMVEPIPVEVEDGYDSDPEVNCYSSSSHMIVDSPTGCEAEQMDISFSSPFPVTPNYSQDQTARAVPPSILLSDHHDVMRLDPIPTDEMEMRESVQQTLNSTWTLRWHPNAENRKKYSIRHNKPIWMPTSPCCCPNSTQKPWSMRLLNACRITPYSSSSSSSSSSSNHGQIDRSKYPMARQNASFLLKSCGGEEFLLEAGCPEDATIISERWKLVIARFACLAVTEDVAGIAKEFFHPTCSDPKMLTVSDPQNDNLTG
eukprot:jgi/Psemu1/31718/gm1.31718_g